MELPIQLKFFKKLELYQELIFQNKKAGEAGGDRRKVWKTEKEILKWTTWNHHYLRSPINHDYIRINILKNKSADKYDKALTNTTQNLIKRGFAIAPEILKDVTDIEFTQLGLLMGEVVNDTEGEKKWPKIKYDLFYKLVWLTAISGALIVIINFFVLLYKGIFKLFLAAIHY